MKLEEVKHVVQVTQGKVRPDLVLKNCRLVNVITGEIYISDISIAGKRIAGLQTDIDPQGAPIIDCEGMFAIPGLIDGHTHIESSLVSPAELARAMVPHGTTTIFMDPHEVGAVLGLKGVRIFMDAVKACPFRAYLQVPSRVPQAPGMESTGGELDSEALQEILAWPETASLGEVDVTKVTHLKDEYLKRIEMYQAGSRIVNGCSAGFTGPELNAYIAAGIAEDHGPRTVEDVMERLRLGMTTIQLRESTSSKDLLRLIKVVDDYGLSTRRLSFCDDDKSIKDIVNMGHMDENVRLAIEAGIAPVEAIQMATINCAEHFHMEYDLGAIAAGRYADILLVEDLDRFPPRKVIFEGTVVAEDGQLLQPVSEFEYPDWFKTTVHLPSSLSEEFLQRDLRTDSATASVRVIHTTGGDLRNQTVIEEVLVDGGFAVADPAAGVNYLVVVNRHGNAETSTTAFVRGFGLRSGALASSIAHDHHNVVAVGASLPEIVFALREVEKRQGAQVVVQGSQVLEELSLPLCGLMSDAPYEQVVEKIDRLTQAASLLGCDRSDPFMDLGFLTLPTVPEVGITDRGLVDALSQEFVPVLIS
jgi:adenine deaminase